VLLLGVLPAVNPLDEGLSQAQAATAGSGVCAQTVDNNSQIQVDLHDGDFVLQFKRAGTTVWTVPNGVTSVQFLIVGGGGGGGTGWASEHGGGGGGAGGFLSGTTSLTSSTYSITLVQSKVALVSGDGFQPDTRVDIWLFSDPTLLGSVVVSADGSFTGEVYLDARFAVAGEHTLQLQGVAEDGFIKAANLGVEVQEPVELTTQSASGLLWWVTGAFVLTLMVTVILVVTRRRRSA